MTNGVNSAVVGGMLCKSDKPSIIIIIINDQWREFAREMYAGSEVRGGWF